MADVFGDLSLFSEFDKHREAEGTFIGYDEKGERSRIVFEGYESEEDDEDDIFEVNTASKENEIDKPKVEPSQESELKVKDDQKDQENSGGPENVNGNASSSKESNQTEDKPNPSVSAENEKVNSWLNEQLHLDAEIEAKKPNVNINQIIYEKNKFKRFCNILDSTRCLPDEDSPAVQLIFSNNTFSRKYRQQIEQFIKGLLWNEFTSGNQKSEAFQEVDVKPGAPSCIELNEKLDPELRTETMRRKHTFIGNSQFHNKFLIDFLGWPFSMTEPVRCNINWEIPLYSQVFNEVFADMVKKDASKEKKKAKPACWNCGQENHSVPECRQPRNPSRISANRKEFMDKQGSNSNTKKFTGATRYHLDPEIASKYAKFSPGKISEPLRKALGLSEDQLPLHIYSLRKYGYPPGWMNEAQKDKSNVALFDKNGRATTGTGECLEEGEVGGQDPMGGLDIGKIIEYPGFTVDAPEGVTDEHEKFEKPPIQEYQLKSTLVKQFNEQVSERKRKRTTEKADNKSGEKEAKVRKLDDEEEGEINDTPELVEDESGTNEDKTVEENTSTLNEENSNEEENGKNKPTETTPRIAKHSSCLSISKDYGTPILVREKSGLPDASKFGVGVEEHLPFENLPNSTGTFAKMKDLIDVIRQKKKNADS